MDDQSAPEIEADEVEVNIENAIQVEMNNDIRPTHGSKWDSQESHLKSCFSQQLDMLLT